MAQPRTKSDAPTKQQVRQLLEHLPDDCTLDDVQYRIHVMQTIQNRLSQVEGARLLSQADVERRVRKWRAAS